MNRKHVFGHLSALLTIMIWGTTFVSTKILLVDFQPMEILFFRFLIGFLILILLYPKRLKITDRKQEFIFAAAGLCGICLYYLLENIALTFTLASNVGVIISIAPFFTALISHSFITPKESLNKPFFAGFVIAMAGIVLISVDPYHMEINPIGDLLAVGAAFVWAIYSLLSKKISTFGYPVILSTRKTFFYGIVFMIPMLFLFDFEMDLSRFTNMTSLLNILYLGLGASALCFVTWNIAVKNLGALRTSVYIYLVPIITVISSVLILKEKLNWQIRTGVVFTLTGLLMSQYQEKGETEHELAK